MPQLDPSSYASQLFWLALCFIPLYWLMASVVLPRISSVLQQRENTIESDISAAKTMQEEAEQFEQEIATSLDAARDQAQQLIGTAKDDVEITRTTRFAELDTELTSKLSNAEKVLNTQRDSALKQIDAVVKDLAPQMVDKVLGVESQTLKKVG